MRGCTQTLSCPGSKWYTRAYTGVSLQDVLQNAFSCLKLCKVHELRPRKEENGYAALCELQVPVKPFWFPKELEVEDGERTLATCQGQPPSASSDRIFLKRKLEFLPT